MTLEEAKKQFKNTKETKYLIKDKGYFDGDKTQLVYVGSELSGSHKEEKNIYLVKGVPYLLTDHLKSKLIRHQDNRNESLDAGILYQDKFDRYKIPVKHFVEIKKETTVRPDVIVPQPTVENVSIVHQFSLFLQNPKENLGSFIQSLVLYSNGTSN